MKLNDNHSFLRSYALFASTVPGKMFVYQLQLSKSNTEGDFLSQLTIKSENYSIFQCVHFQMIDGIDWLTYLFT